MKKQPGIFVKLGVFRDAQHPTQGGGSTLTDSIVAMIDAGNVVAVGEDSIELVFDKSMKFKAWHELAFSPAAGAVLANANQKIVLKAESSAK